MPNDLLYFYESNLNKGCLVDFVNSLPTQELQDKFLASKGVLGFIDRDTMNVLQGYRGPYTNGSSRDSSYLGPINGLQEIRYWWGISKRVNWLPIIGTAAWGICRLAGDTRWHSMFFDSKSGECLSHDIETAALKLNVIGETLFQNGKFSEAKEYFSNAYNVSLTSANFNLYNKNIDKAQVEIEALNLYLEGDTLFHQGKYAEAKAKFKEASYKSKVRNQNEMYKSNKDKARAENDALNLNSEGDQLVQEGKYAEARAKFQAASDKSNIRKQRKIYNRNVAKAQAKLDALHMIFEEETLFNKGKYAKDKTKHQAADDKSGVRIRKHEVCKSNSDKAQVEIEAINLNSEGDKLFHQGKYTEARAKYQAAYDKTSVRKQYVLYKSNADKAQANIDAINLTFEGDNLLNQGKYAEAGAKYQAAYDKSNVREQRKIYKSKIDKTQAGLDALNLISEGEKAFKKGKYAKAKAKYEAACSRSYNCKHYALDGKRISEKLKFLNALENLQEIINSDQNLTSSCQDAILKDKIKNPEICVLNARVHERIEFYQNYDVKEYEDDLKQMKSDQINKLEQIITGLSEKIKFNTDKETLDTKRVKQEELCTKANSFWGNLSGLDDLLKDIEHFENEIKNVNISSDVLKKEKDSLLYELKTSRNFLTKSRAVFQAKEFMDVYKEITDIETAVNCMMTQEFNKLEDITNTSTNVRKYKNKISDLLKSVQDVNTYDQERFIADVNWSKDKLKLVLTNLEIIEWRHACMHEDEVKEHADGTNKNNLNQLKMAPNLKLLSYIGLFLMKILNKMDKNSHELNMVNLKGKFEEKNRFLLNFKCNNSEEEEYKNKLLEILAEFENIKCLQGKCHDSINKKSLSAIQSCKTEVEEKIQNCKLQNDLLDEITQAIRENKNKVETLAIDLTDAIHFVLEKQKLDAITNEILALKTELESDISEENINLLLAIVSLMEEKAGQINLNNNENLQTTVLNVKKDLQKVKSAIGLRQMEVKYWS